MGKTINDVSNRPQPQPLDLETFANKKEPEQKQKEQPAPSGVSDAKWEETYAGMHDAPNIDWSQVHGNNADPTALAQQAGKAQQAKAKAPAKSVFVAVSNVDEGDKFILGPPTKNSSTTARDKSEFDVAGARLLDKKSTKFKNLVKNDPALQKFSHGEGPIDELDVVSGPKGLHHTWFYNEESKLWGYYDNNKFHTSDVGPDGRVIEQYVHRKDLHL